MKYYISWTEHIRYTAVVDWPDDIQRLRDTVHCYPGTTALGIDGVTTQTRQRWDELRANALPEYGSADSFEVEPLKEEA